MTAFFRKSCLGLSLSISFFTALQFFVLVVPAPLYAQPSIIEVVQELFPSLVSVTAENFDVALPQKKAAAIDKETGRLIILNNIKAAAYKRSGAGVIIDPAGLIITNFHTIAQANRIAVTLTDNTTLNASVINVFPQTDLAIIGIAPSRPLSSIVMADSNGVKLGDEIFSVGHSELLNKTISEGKIIGLGVLRQQQTENDGDTHLFQVNMNLYKGDSGGPLFNRRGELIGIIVAGETDADRSSFAVPSNKIKKLYQEHLAKEKKKL